MALILVLDDCSRNACRLSKYLHDEGHEVHVAADIAGTRAVLKSVRQRCLQPVLCLVELVRWRENGFTLAAALAAREHARVVLVSDREQGSDLPWALARGVDAVVSRREGMPAMMMQINRLLVADCELSPDERTSEGEASEAEETRVANEVDEEADKTKRAASAALAAELQKCVSAIVMQAGSISADSHRQIEEWFVRGKHSLGPVLTALAFLPGIGKQSPGLLQDESARQFLTELLVLKRKLLIYPAVLRHATATDCLVSEAQQVCAEHLIALSTAVLRKSVSAGEQTRALREILRTGLALQTAALPAPGRYSNSVLEPWITLTAILLHMPGLRTLIGLRQLTGLLSQESGAEPAAVVNSGSQLPPETKRLVCEVADSVLRGGGRSTHASVGLYKLACHLRMLDPTPVLLCSAVSSLYVSLCYREIPAPAEVQPLLQALCCFVSDDANPYMHLYRMLRYEVCSVRSALNDDEQVALASQLHRLPQPVRWLRELDADDPLMDLLVRDVSRELAILGEGAGRLDVPEIESLSLILLQLYNVIEHSPEVLQVAAMRQRLARAHRSLCRMLDQAAAWQPVSRAGLMIESLCSVLDNMPLRGSGPADGVRDVPLPDANAWLHCRAVNQRLRTILRHGGAPNSSRSVIIELLRSQNDLIRRQLTYQQGR